MVVFDFAFMVGCRLCLLYVWGLFDCCFLAEFYDCLFGLRFGFACWVMGW